MSIDSYEGFPHLEFQLSPALVEFALNKYLTADHPVNQDTGEPGLNASTCVKNIEFIVPGDDESSQNVLLVRILLGEYWHDVHMYVPKQEHRPVLTLRCAIEGEENRSYLRITLENLDFPEQGNWSPEMKSKIQETIDNLIEELEVISALPGSLSGFGFDSLTIDGYFLKCTTKGHALLGIKFAGLDMDTDAFFQHHDGLTANTDHLWGFLTSHWLIKRLLQHTLHGQIESNVELDWLQLGDIEFDDFKLEIHGSGTFITWYNTGPGLTREECDIGFHYTVKLHISPEPAGRFIHLHLDPIQPDPDTWDIINCHINQQTVSNLILAIITHGLFGIFSNNLISSDSPSVLSNCLPVFIINIINGFLNPKKIDIPKINTAGIKDLGDGDYQVSLADIIPDLGGLLWPLRPLELHWPVKAENSNTPFVSITGDLGVLPDDPQDKLHPAYQFSANPDAIQTEFSVFGPLLLYGQAIGYTTVVPARVFNNNENGLVALCDWKLEECEESNFTHAFTLVSESPSKRTVIITPDGHIPIYIQCGPYVYSKKEGMLYPNNAFQVNTQFRAYLTVTYMQVNNQVIDYTLEYKELRIPLVATVKDPIPRWEGIPGLNFWILADRLIMNELTEYIESLDLLDFFDMDFPVHKEDWTAINIFSDDPGLEEIRFLDNKGELISSCKSCAEMRTVIDPKREYGLMTKGKKGKKTTFVSFGLELFSLCTQLTFKEKVIAVSLSGTILGIAFKQMFQMYDIGDPNTPRLIGTYTSQNEEIRGIYTERIQERRGFAVFTDEHVVMIGPPTPYEKSYSRLNTITFPRVKEIKNLRVLNQCKHKQGIAVIMIITNTDVKIVEVTKERKTKEISKRIIKKDQRVITAKNCLVIITESKLRIISLPELKKAISEYKLETTVKDIEVHGNYLYLFGSNDEITVLSIENPAKPAVVSRIRYQSYSKNLLMGRKNAFRLVKKGTSINCYRRTSFPVKKHHGKE